VRALAAVSAPTAGELIVGKNGGIAYRFSLTDSNGFSAQRHRRLWCRVIGDNSVRQLK
jgi:hypothetical protein